MHQGRACTPLAIRLTTQAGLSSSKRPKAHHHHHHHQSKGHTVSAKRPTSPQLPHKELCKTPTKVSATQQQQQQQMPGNRRPPAPLPLPSRQGYLVQSSEQRRKHAEYPKRAVLARIPQAKDNTPRTCVCVSMCVRHCLPAPPPRAPANAHQPISSNASHSCGCRDKQQNVQQHQQ